ncbi:MAG TPA: GEVED domain-containing protein, partial [Caldilineaceae bacterium]|nr:GEVED domain-containing protein [Caldilineaceae bacterium]
MRQVHWPLHGWGDSVAGLDSLLLAPGVAAAQTLDFGDAPASYGTPSHEAHGPWLGLLAPDDDPAATFTASADGDDNSASDDEDAFAGIITQTLSASPTIAPFSFSKVIACGPDGAVLRGYIDIDGDGNFTSSGDERSTSAICSEGFASLSWNITKTGIVVRHTYLRLRIALNDSEIDDPPEQATGGEVEDHLFAFAPPAELRKAFYPTTITTGQVTTLTFTISNTLALAVGEGTVGFTDSLPSNLRVAASPSITDNGQCGAPLVSAPAGGTNIAVSGVYVAAGAICRIRVRITNAAGQANASCTASPASFTNRNTNLTSLTSNLLNRVLPSCLVVRDRDYGDAPASYGNPSHLITGPFLGLTSPDAEITGAASTGANGDDLARGDDENAFSTIVTQTLPAFPTTGGFSFAKTVACSPNGAAVRGYVDINGNGAFETTEERSVFTTCSSGSATLTWNLTSSGLSALNSYLRLRIANASASIDDPTENASTGEVEDHPFAFVPPVELRKAFGTPQITSGEVVTLTFTLSNTLPGAVNQSALGFVDTLPASLRVATRANISNNGQCGPVSVSATGGGASVAVSGANVTGGKVCQITL